jgi:hypothetical protein
MFHDQPPSPLTPPGGGFLQLKPEMYKLASEMAGHLRAQVAEFEKTLSDGEEAVACLANFGHDVRVAVEGLGYRNPDLVIFFGVNMASKARVQLLLHLTQVNVLLEAVPAQTAPPRRMGFATP